MTRLTPLLDPESVVIVGASSNFSRTGGIPIENFIAGGFPRERLLLVNPKYPEIAGLPCSPSIAALPWTPDLAVLAIRAAETLPALAECHARGIRAAVVFASGFAEEASDETRALQAALVRFADETGMVVAGPNCLGHVNYRKRVFATFLKNMATDSEPGPVAVVAQSGNMASVLRRASMGAGLRCSYLVNTGNEACTELAEYLEHFAEDADTQAVIGYVEQIRDGTRFMRVAARLRKAAKPLFLIKAGQSEKGAEATASHTAAMAGDGRAYRAAFAQLGIVTATDPYRLVDLVTMWRSGRRPGGLRACVLSVSGAGCALLADLLSAEGIALPTLGRETQARLRSVVPSYGMVSNPVDLTGQVTNDSAFFPVVMDAIADCPDVDAVVFYVMGYLLDQMAPDLIRVASGTGKLLVVIDTAVGATSHAALRAAGVAVFSDMNRGVGATAGWLHWSAGAATLQWEPAAAMTDVPSPAPELLQARAEGRTLLNEVEAKSMLARAGLPMVQERIVRDADGAVAAAAAFGGPVALKILSPDIPHKSDVGGVALDLRDASAVRAAFDRVITSVARAQPAARRDGVVVQPMVQGGQSVLLGVVRDPVFGPMMTVGLGGVLTELYADVATRVLPVDAAMAGAMLRELRSFPLLDGYRGAVPADVAALIETMVGLSDFMLKHGAGIAELELNPVQVLRLGEGAVAVDALVRLDAA
jgi:acyl-CoA synthetase (NDP forming)